MARRCVLLDVTAGMQRKFQQSQHYRSKGMRGFRSATCDVRGTGESAVSLECGVKCPSGTVSLGVAGLIALEGPHLLLDLLLEFLFALFVGDLHSGLLLSAQSA